MKFSENPYYSPEKCGLQILDSINTAGSYEYDMFVVWVKLDDNSIWWATDSGCSCPVPFEVGRHDLHEITEETYYNFDLALKNHKNLKPQDYFMILNAVRRHLKMMA
ncbi:MAG: hypothetical protein RLZZ546_1138 [Bacteroidota bacterium]|jgi:hypothetical protein